MYFYLHLHNLVQQQPYTNWYYRAEVMASYKRWSGFFQMENHRNNFYGETLSDVYKRQAQDSPHVLFGNNNFIVKINHKKSEFGLNYNNVYRSVDNLSLIHI